MSKPTSGPYAPPPLNDPVAHLLGRVAWLMDRAIAVPGTNVRVGLDALLGIVPVGGDVLTGLVQAGLVLVALGRYRVPQAVAARMMGNVLLDTCVGSIPLLGDLFDVGFKANTRNMTLLAPYLGRPEAGPDQRPASAWTSAPAPAAIELLPAATSWGCLLAVAVVLLGTLALVLVGFLTVVRLLLRA